MTTFPDQEYLKRLTAHLRDRVDEERPDHELLLMYCGALLNWVSDYVGDESVTWSKQTLRLDDLWLTGTNAEWNAIIIERCERSAEKFRALLDADALVKAMFQKAHGRNEPILVRYDDDKRKVLYGMPDTVVAIRDGQSTIEAFVAKTAGKPKTVCEQHIVYDLIRAYQRGLSKDRTGLVAALRFLNESYSNVGETLRVRFQKALLPEDEVQQIIAEVLAK